MNTKQLAIIAVAVFFVATCFGLANSQAAIFNGVADNERDDLGYYYAITGGKFVNGQTVNGLKTSGGSMAYTTDDAGWGYATDVWNKDGWFAQTAGLALTMNYLSGTVYDNFNNDAGDFYTTPEGQTSGSTPGLYRGYAMSNNYDWVYAGYFVLTEETTIDQITGYFDAVSGFDPDSLSIRYRMNIWSNTNVDKGTYIEKRPVFTNSFDGDVLCSDSTSGAFSWGDSGVDRIFGSDYGYAHDDILYTTFTLDAPLVLPAGEYWFSHDASVIPEPGTMIVWSLLGLVAASYGLWRRNRAA